VKLRICCPCIIAYPR